MALFSRDSFGLTNDEKELLIKNKQNSYDDLNLRQRQSSRLEWVEASWTRWWSLICWCWMRPLLSLSFKRPLMDDDLDGLSHPDKSSTLLNEMLAHDWATATTWNIIVRTFWKPIVLSGLPLLPRTIVRILKVLIVRQIINFIHDSQTSSSVTTISTTVVYLYVVVLFLCTFIEASSNYQFLFRSNRISLRVRNALMSIMYSRILSIYTSSLQKTSSAQIINFIAHDVTKLEGFVGRVNYLWQTPLEAFLVFVCLLWIIGIVPALLSYTIFFILIPTQMLFSRQFNRYSATTAACVDKRVHAFNEIVSGCWIIKMYNWEKPMEDYVLRLRKEEFCSIQKSSYLRALNMAIFFASVPLISLTAFVGAWLSGYELKTVDIFTALAFYGQMRMSVARYFPQAIEKLSEMLTATKRIDGFMRLPTIKQQIVLMPQIEQKHGAITMSNASFSWDNSVDCLSSLNIEIKPGMLVGIIGQVGSGKSSLLAAILGEMNLTNGELHLNNSTFSYAAQSPWIFADTLRENILLGKPYDIERYNSVLHACCLDFDLAAFGPSGDLTMLGENGVNLSGGQKARVSLARALYVNVDTYLLDDPFSSVDRTVATQIYDRCIGPHGLLGKKTRLIVTHQTEFLAEAHHAILLKHGRILMQGHFDEVPDEFKKINQLDQDNKENEPIRASMLEIKQSSVDKKSIITDEASLEGGTKWSLCSSLFIVPPLRHFRFGLLIFLLITGEILYDSTNYWLRLWSNPLGTDSQKQRSMVYTVLIFATVLMALVRAKFFFYLILKGSDRLHNNMLRAVLYTSMRFFDSTPRGRILNRASADQHVVDELLPATLFDAIQLILMAIGSVVVMSIVNPWVLITFIPLAPLFWMICRYYKRPSYQLKRLENTSRSPIYTQFASTLNGLITIRAFKTENDFMEAFSNKIDTNTRAQLAMMGATYWFCFHLDLLVMLFSSFNAVILLILRQHIEPAAAALGLTYSVNISQSFHASIRQLMDAEHLMTSIERIDEYVKLEPEEDNGGSQRLVKTPSDWPNYGKVEFQNYSLCYRPGLEAALKSINLCVLPEEKIGIIGRTGMFFRLRTMFDFTSVYPKHYSACYFQILRVFLLKISAM
ncbi:hypothetical protein I4U23_000114 [Adineta vaga]|nr:hypothetical protein I4U23_000114 [Adineta vaga]